MEARFGERLITWKRAVSRLTNFRSGEDCIVNCKFRRSIISSCTAPGWRSIKESDICLLPLLYQRPATKTNRLKIAWVFPPPLTDSFFRTLSGRSKPRTAVTLSVEVQLRASHDGPYNPVRACAEDRDPNRMTVRIRRERRGEGTRCLMCNCSVATVRPQRVTGQARHQH